MTIFSMFAVSCALATALLLAHILRSFRRYGQGLLPYHAFVRDTISTLGLALVACSVLFLRLTSLVATDHTILWMLSLTCFVTGVACVVGGFGILVRENRRSG